MIETDKIFNVPYGRDNTLNIFGDWDTLSLRVSRGGGEVWFLSRRGTDRSRVLGSGEVVDALTSVFMSLSEGI
jgi:hypothetical protein